MFPYWLLFLFPLVGALVQLHTHPQAHRIAWGVFAVLATLMIGLRYEIGTDWVAYIMKLNKSTMDSFLEVITSSDPSYKLINWLSARLGFGIAGVNLISGALFIYGILRFCRQQPLPWLGLVIATPYLLIVVGMGYTRQAIALGFVCWAFTAWREKNFLKYSVLVLLATSFHISAIIMFFFGMFIHRQHRLIKPALLVFLLVLCYQIVQPNPNIMKLIQLHMIGHNHSSPGGLVRLLMSAVPAIILLVFSKRFSPHYEDHRLWQMIAITSLLFFFTIFTFSTATDRLALYFAPIQIAVYTRLPLLITNPLWRRLTFLFIILLYASVLFVWLHFANHAEDWLPYQLTPFS